MRKIYSNFDVKSPVEKCLEILSEARKEVDDNLMLKDIEWCMEMISANKLYDPLIGFKRDEENFGAKKNEVAEWIESYEKPEKDNKKNEKRGSMNGLTVPNDGKSRRPSHFGMSYANLSAIPPNVLKSF